MCCYPTDTVVRAAEIMRNEDVGPVPVVDPSSGKLLGLVTDRDITIQVVARGGDCGSVQVQEIMSSDLITCSVDDDYHSALESMSRHQVRRIPVVHADGTLAGIISQADVARYSSEAETGSVVEDISDASSFAITSPDTMRSSGPSFLVGAACFTLGAACMYMLDPDRGRARRAKTRDKATRVYNDSAWIAGKVQRDLRNRTTGTMAEVKQRLGHASQEDVPEGKLVARVRSKMGHYVSHPQAIEVSCTADGCVHLSGEILRDELPSLLSAIRSVPGVRQIDNRLNVQQGAAEGSEFSPAMRVLVGALGSGLAVYGMKANGAVAKTAGTIGLGLVASGITNVPVTNLAHTIMHREGSSEVH
jgi:predicted transcriptional regulator